MLSRNVENFARPVGDLEEHKEFDDNAKRQVNLQLVQFT